MSLHCRGLGVALTIAAALAQDPVVGTRLDGPSIAAGDVSSDDGATITFVRDNDQPTQLTLDELDSITFLEPDGLAPRAPAGRVWLRSGPSCEAVLRGGDRQSARMDLLYAKDAELPWRTLRALRLQPLQDADEAAFAAALAAPQATADALFARDRSSGATTRLSVVVLGIRDGSLLVDFRGERPVPLDQVLAIVFGDENGAAPAPVTLPSVAVELLLSDSKTTNKETWRGKLVGIDPLVVRLRLAEGSTVQLPRPSIAKIAIESSKVRWLDALEPIEIERTGAFDVKPTWQRNGTSFGESLRVARRVFARGLCLRPRTKLTYVVPDGFDRFEAHLGVDARSEGPADAVVRIHRGDLTVFQTEHLNVRSSHALRIPIQSGDRLVIEVDFGDNFDLGDHVVLANARFLRG